MYETFKIFVDQLREGHERTFDESLSPDFLEIHEPDLDFKKNIELKGVAYTAEDELVINWTIRTEALVSCSICNEKVPVDIEINNFYHSESLSNIKGAVFNFKDLLREIILLEVPLFAECNQGQCSRRTEISKFLKEPVQDQADEEGYRPFADLDWKP